MTAYVDNKTTLRSEPLQGVVVRSFLMAHNLLMNNCPVWFFDTESPRKWHISPWEYAECLAAVNEFRATGDESIIIEDCSNALSYDIALSSTSSVIDIQYITNREFDILCENIEKKYGKVISTNKSIQNGVPHLAFSFRSTLPNDSTALNVLVNIPEPNGVLKYLSVPHNGMKKLTHPDFGQGSLTVLAHSYFSISGNYRDNDGDHFNYPNEIKIDTNTKLFGDVLIRAFGEANPNT